jgi:hypothetical protein
MNVKSMPIIVICCRNLQSDFTVATEDLRLTMAEGKVTVYVLLDFTKAFDLINHGLFVHKLCSRYDFHTSAMGMGFIVSPGSFYA